MKNLIVKTLFILLLLSAVIPSGIQASLFTHVGKNLIGVWNNSAKNTVKNAWNFKGVSYSMASASVVPKPLNVGGTFKSYRKEKKLPEKVPSVGKEKLQQNLFDAINSDDEIGAEQAIKLGADVDKQCDHGPFTPLMLAGFNGNLKMAKLLFNNRANL